AAEMRALAVCRRDRSGTVDQEEAPLGVEDRLVLRRLELGDDVGLLPRGDLRAETLDLDDLEERQEGCGELADRKERRGQEADTKELAPLDARQHPAGHDRGV